MTRKSFIMKPTPHFRYIRGKGAVHKSPSSFRLLPSSGIGAAQRRNPNPVYSGS